MGGSQPELDLDTAKTKNREYEQARKAYKQFLTPPPGNPSIWGEELQQLIEAGFFCPLTGMRKPSPELDQSNAIGEYVKAKHMIAELRQQAYPAKLLTEVPQCQLDMHVATAIPDKSFPMEAKRLEPGSAEAKVALLHHMINMCDGEIRLRWQVEEIWVHGSPNLVQATPTHHGSRPQLRGVPHVHWWGAWGPQASGVAPILVLLEGQLFRLWTCACRWRCWDLLGEGSRDLDPAYIAGDLWPSVLPEAALVCLGQITCCREETQPGTTWWWSTRSSRSHCGEEEVPEGDYMDFLEQMQLPKPTSVEEWRLIWREVAPCWQQSTLLATPRFRWWTCLWQMWWIPRSSSASEPCAMRGFPSPLRSFAPLRRSMPSWRPMCSPAPMWKSRLHGVATQNSGGGQRLILPMLDLSIASCCRWRWLLDEDPFADGISWSTTPSHHRGECELCDGQGFQEEGWGQREAHFLGQDGVWTGFELRHAMGNHQQRERGDDWWLYVQALSRLLEAGPGCHSPGPNHWTQQGQEGEFAAHHGGFIQSMDQGQDRYKRAGHAHSTWAPLWHVSEFPTPMIVDQWARWFGRPSWAIGNFPIFSTSARWLISMRGEPEALGMQPSPEGLPLCPWRCRGSNGFSFIPMFWMDVWRISTASGVVVPLHNDEGHDWHWSFMIFPPGIDPLFACHCKKCWSDFIHCIFEILLRLFLFGCSVLLPL